MKTFATVIIGLFAVTMVAQKPSFVPSKNIYVYNKGKDTLHFEKFDFRLGFEHNKAKVADSVQVDGAGSKELVFFREGSGGFSNHGGTFDIIESKSLSKYEIWNIDTKTLLFEAVSAWSHHNSTFDIRLDPARQQFDCHYKYDFAIDAEGIITIKNYSGTKDGKPDHTTGTYQFINGKYIKLTDEPAKN